jgi:FAD/FMN-containing dehydrogenase
MNGTLYSWGRYPSFPQTAHPCYWRSDLGNNLAKMAQIHGTSLAYGNGRSYGDSCLAASGHVLHMQTLDRFIAADWEMGLIKAEAGVTLDQLLRLAIPRGWFPPVTPGTKYVTLGGALANDVHGKNHHMRGTFGCHVRRFGLVRSDRPPLICSPQENPELFSATIGGLGLTGIIEWLEIQLMPIRSSLIDFIHVRFSSLNEFFSLSAELDSAHEYTVSWVDCLAKGKSAGRGVYMAGNHAPQGPLAYDDKPKRSMPFTPPFSPINSLSLRLFNTAYYWRHRIGRHNSRISYEPFFYPLDRIRNWNRIYGLRGFQQYQCAIPDKNSAAAVPELLSAIAASHSGSFLAVLKRFGNITSPGLLSFPLPGVTLTLDFPQQGETTARLFDRLDAIVREAGGRLYPAKDAHMRGEDFRAAYLAWERLESLRDPALSSRFWQRATAK